MIDSMVAIYNQTPHTTTGYSPYFLMFGRNPKLIIDLITPTHPHTAEYDPESVSQELREAYRIAKENNMRDFRSRNRNTERTNPARTLLTAGDTVFLQAVPSGRSKISDHWDPTPYVIKESINKGTTYQVVRADGVGPVKTRRREHLLRMDHTDDAEVEDDLKSEEGDM